MRSQALRSACAAAVMMLAAGGLGLAFRQPWLFPSLGPSAFLHVYRPRRETTGFYHTVVGHGIGVAAGYLSVFLFHAWNSPAVMAADALTPSRLGASTAAIFLTVMIQIAVDAIHPPAAATTLLIALGAFRPEWRDAAALSAGIVLIAAMGTAIEDRMPKRAAPDTRR